MDIMPATVSIDKVVGRFIIPVGVKRQKGGAEKNIDIVRHYIDTQTKHEGEFVWVTPK